MSAEENTLYRYGLCCVSINDNSFRARLVSTEKFSDMTNISSTPRRACASATARMSSADCKKGTNLPPNLCDVVQKSHFFGQPTSGMIKPADSEGTSSPKQRLS